MRSVGMCRMCLVEIDAGRGPALQPACMISVAEGMKVDTASPRTRKAQDGVLEFLLINHPLDCPVCDKGGECPLQDQTMSYGPGESRFVEEKRHYEKPIPISDLVFLDRERCILCDRCTRFAKEVAGDPLIHFIDRGSSTQVNTFPDEPFSSYFSGNTVQICPVGALTATAYRFRARPWDLDEVESTCQNCSVGCSVTLQSSRNRLLRTNGVDNDAVNWSWLCDRGRFSFEATNSEERLGEPLLRQGGTLAPVRWADALRAAALAVSVAVADHGPGSVAVLGGARLTNESQYAWAKLAKGIVGTDHVDAQLGDGLPGRLPALPAAGDDRPGLCAEGHDRPARSRSQGDARRPLPAPAARHRRGRRPAHRARPRPRRPLRPGRGQPARPARRPGRPGAGRPRPGRAAHRRRPAHRAARSLLAHRGPGGAVRGGVADPRGAARGPLPADAPALERVRRPRRRPRRPACCPVG